MKERIFIALNTIIDQGGISTSIQNLLNEIHDEYEVTICATSDYISPHIKLPDNVTIVRGSSLIGYALVERRLMRLGLSGKIRMLLTRWVRRLLGFEFILNKGIKAINIPEIEYDAAIAFSGNQYKADGTLSVGGDYDLVLKRINAKKKIAWMHNDLRKEGYTREIAYRVYRDFDAIVAVSAESKALIDDMVPEYKEKTCVIYNTYNLRKIDELSKKGNPYDNSENIHFVTVARLDLRQKRQDRIIEACGRLKKEGFTGFDWYLVGGGDQDTLMTMAENHDVKDIIHFTGLQKNPYPYMLHADAFVLTSLYEGFGMTIKEAQILNCPTLVTHFGPADEAVENGKQGIICDNSTEGVYTMIKSVLKKPTVLKEYRSYLLCHPVTNEIALNQFRIACGFKG